MFPESEREIDEGGCAEPTWSCVTAQRASGLLIASVRGVNISKTLGTLTLVGLALLVLPGEALATKAVFHGSTCQTFNPPWESGGTGVWRGNYGIRNSASPYRFVVCPISWQNGFGGNITDIEVSMYDTSGQSWCTVVTADQHNRSGGYKTRYTSTAGLQVSDFGSIPYSSYEGTYFVRCLLRPNAEIRSIVVDES